MRRLLRWLAYALGGIAALFLVGAGWVWYASARELGGTLEAAPERLAAPTPQQLADGPRQLRILGCFSCHGEGLRGRRIFHEQGIATIWAPNLTELAANASDQQLAQGIRQGIGSDGRPLFVMPSGLFSRLSDAEVAAVIAAIRALPRGGERTPEISVGPIGRLGLATGRFRTAHASLPDFRARTPLAVGAEH